jgi:two-component system, LytTR family, response regulator
MPIRALVVSRNAETAAELTALLRTDPDVDAVECCGDCSGAGPALARAAPDLVFLDAQLPDDAGFALAASLPEPAPLVVFVSADDAHARLAFDANALDYLLRPVQAQRLHVALARARAQLACRDARRGERVLVKVNGLVRLLNRADIDWVESAGNYLKLYVGPVSYLVRRTMSQMERDLGTDRFVRIHRSHLVNIARIDELHPTVDGDGIVVLRGGVRLAMSRGYRERVQQCLGHPR